MQIGSGFSVLIVEDDGRRTRRFSVPRWVVRASIGLATIAMVGNVALIGHYTMLRRAQGGATAQAIAALDQGPTGELAPGAQPPASLEPSHPASQAAPTPADPTASVAEELASTRRQLAAAREQLAQKIRILEPVERRLVEVREEIRGWDGLHAAILKPLGGEPRGRAAGGSERGRGRSEGTALEVVNTVLATVRQESHRLRAIARVTRETGEFLASVPSRSPMRTAINSGFGMRRDPFGGGGQQFHAGIDFAAATGTPVSAAAGGIVRVAGTATGYGNTVLLDHGRGFETRYGHLHSIGVTTGQRVERGQAIGLSGNTGRSTAPHLHYEVLVDGRPVDPRRLIRE